jgi:hypothetical protein
MILISAETGAAGDAVLPGAVEAGGRAGDADDAVPPPCSEQPVAMLISINTASVRQRTFFLIDTINFLLKFS